MKKTKNLFKAITISAISAFIIVWAGMEGDIFSIGWAKFFATLIISPFVMFLTIIPSAILMTLFEFFIEKDDEILDTSSTFITDTSAKIFKNSSL